MPLNGHSSKRWTSSCFRRSASASAVSPAAAVTAIGVAAAHRVAPLRTRLTSSSAAASSSSEMNIASNVWIATSDSAASTKVTSCG